MSFLSRVHRHALCVALALGLTAGCSEGSAPSAEPDQSSASSSPTPRPTAASSTAAPTTPKQRLAAAVERVLDAEPVGFGYDIGFMGVGAWLTGQGRYDASIGGWQVESTIDSTVFGDDLVRELSVRSQGGRVWMQMADWTPPAQGCWLEMPTGTAPLGLSAMQGRRPLYLWLLGDLRAGRLDGPAMRGTVRLDLALSLLTTQLVESLGLDDLTTLAAHRTSVRIFFGPRGIDEVVFDGAPLVRSLHSAGVTVPEQLRPVLQRLRAKVEYPAASERDRGAFVPPPGTAYSGDGGVTC